jgi:MYXO-CTERM domain-containing protein
MDIITLSAAAALATIGYGEVVDGQPNWAQREMHVYTNFARVAPEDWESEYDCSLSEFTSDERTAKAPLYYHDGLTEIAQAHSEDMDSNEFMAHESSDGTDFGTRVWPWYDGMMIAENVAWGYVDNWDVVFEGWMCSAGHRENIMSGDLEDVGTGVSGRSYTQDFGAGAATTDIQVAMGIHYPADPVREIEFMATWEDDEGPAGLWVETADDCHEMTRLAGTDARGAWSVETESDDGCAAYRFVWETASGVGGELPETGAYQYGAGCEEWISTAPDGCEVESDGGSDGGGSDGGGSDDGGSDGGPSDDGSSDNDSDDDGVSDEERQTSRTPRMCADSSNPRCADDDDSDGGKGCSTSATSAPTGGFLLLLSALLLGSRRRD